MTVIINGTTGITNVNGSAAAPAETGTDTDTGIVYGTNTLSLATGGTTALTANSSQGIQVLNTIGVGNATPSTSGAGISFPATQSASTDANTLDDYEEGTWNPVATPGGGGSLTSYTSSGYYTKIGRVVSIVGQFTFTNVGSAGGSLNISGLPFQSLDTGLARSATGVAREDASTGIMYGLYGAQGNTTAVIHTMTNGGITWTNGYRYTFSFTYLASA